MNAAVDIMIVPHIDASIFAQAMEESERTGRSALSILEETSGLTAEELTVALADTFDYEVIVESDLATIEPAFDLLTPSDATQRCCVLARRGESLLAVMVDPFDKNLRAWLEVRIPQMLQWALCSRADFESFMARHEKAHRAIEGVLAEAVNSDNSVDALSNLSLVSISQDKSPIIKFVHSTVYDALRSDASDIHFESTPSGLAVRYRIDGVLVNVTTAAGVEISEQVISRIKVMSELDIAERRVPQDGRFKLAIDKRPVDFRVSIMPSVHGEDAVVRVLDKQALTESMQGLRLDALGFDPMVVEQLRRLSSLPYGMLLVTGPTGSGKTTTLYAAISETHTGNDKIVTIEDPVEYQLPGVLQIPVNEKKGLTFARGLRSILRHDPDKIMVGEIRDPETAQIAIQSALTGHLVFTTVHANNVFDVMSRFVHMGVDSYSFVSALSGILAQRLIRIICEQCAGTYVPSRKLLAESQVSIVATAGFEFRKGRGCSHCRGTGYRGRKAIGELLLLDDELREAIVARVPVRQLKKIAHSAGIRLIRTVALDLVARGETTLEEVNRVTIMA